MRFAVGSSSAILLAAASIALAGVGVAQDLAVPEQPLRPIALPSSARGLVHRDTVFGCGQSWETHEAWSSTSLEVSARRRARLVVDARVVDESGGVSRLLEGPDTPYHTSHERRLHVEWSGRARREGDALVIALGDLTETIDVDGAPPGTRATNRSTLAVTLTCVHEAHDVFAADRPTVRDGEPPTAHRTLVSCRFEPLPNEGPLPRPVADLLTTPFLLDTGRGVTTDASYDGYFRVPAPYLVARERGGSP